MPQALSSAQIAAVKSLLAWSPEGDLHALAEQLQQLLDGFVGDLPPYEATLTRRLADYLPRLARELDLSDEPIYLPEDAFRRATDVVDGDVVSLSHLTDLLDDLGEFVPFGAATKTWNHIVDSLRTLIADEDAEPTAQESAPLGDSSCEDHEQEDPYSCTALTALLQHPRQAWRDTDEDWLPGAVVVHPGGSGSLPPSPSWPPAPPGWEPVPTMFGVVYRRADCRGQVEPKDPNGTRWRAVARSTRFKAMRIVKLPTDIDQTLENVCAVVDTWITNNAPRTP